MNRTRKICRYLAATLLTMVLAVSTFTMNLSVARATTLSNPRIENMEENLSGTLSNPRIGSNGVATWDCVYFGNYPQSDSTGETKEPIKWRVLSVDGNDAFLVADQNLDMKEYNNTKVGVTWETCTMRSWLNGYGSDSNINGVDYSTDNFIDRAFTEEEQNAILTTTLENADNPEPAPWGAEGGNDTNDKVFLLSYDDVTNEAYGIIDARTRKNSNYAKTKGAWTCSEEEYSGNGSWWLRSPGQYSYSAMYVTESGYITEYGSAVNYGYVSRNGDYGHKCDAVCPALHLDISSSDFWSYAGTGCSSTITGSTGVVTWDCVYFGGYPQSDSTGKTYDPIKWRVLSVDGNDAFLVADQNLDAKEYNFHNVDVTWETCKMRSWLNGYGSSTNVDGTDYTSDNFIDSAFTVEEQNAILTTTLENADSPEYETEDGNDTDDKIFLLSYEDVTNAAYGFSADYNSSDKARRRQNTNFAKKQGASTNSSGNGCWWLRSPGDCSDSAMIVDSAGYVYQSGSIVGYTDYTVCPALHLDLSCSNVWSYAGTVSSDGSVTQGENPPSRNVTSLDEESTTEAETPTTENSSETHRIPATVAAKGTILKDKASGAVYKVSSTAAQNPTVICQKAINRSSREIKIPAAIVVNGVSYKVTAIAANAFKNNKKLTKVTIGKNITSIGKNAFRGCRKLTKITVKSTGLTKNSVGKNSLKGTSKKLTIKVPRSKLKDYQKFFKKKGNASVKVKK